MTGMEHYRDLVRASLQRQGDARDLTDLEVAIIIDAYRDAMSCSHAAAAIRAARSMAGIVAVFANRRGAA
jgi:hypothetical protein